jgi:hypothetical protein
MKKKMIAANQMKAYTNLLKLIAIGAVIAVALAACGGKKPNPASDFGDEDSGAISSYSGKSKSVVIPAEIGGEPVTLVDAYAFADNTAITSVVIPEGVTSIGDFAFANCTSLKRVTLPTSLKTIGDGAFMHCAGLSTVANLPAATDDSGAPVLERLGDFAFGGCGKLDGKTRAALTELGVTDVALGTLGISYTVLEGVPYDITRAAHYDPNLPVKPGDMVARNLFAQYALVNTEDTQARLVAAVTENGAFRGVIELSNNGKKLMEISLLLLSATDGNNYLVHTQLSNIETGVELNAFYSDIPEITNADFSSAARARAKGQAIGLAIGMLILPIKEQGFYNVRRLADKTNPGVISPAVLANEQNP